MNQQQWMDRFVGDILRLFGESYELTQRQLTAVLAVAWDQAASYNYSCGFEDGSGQQRNDLDAVLRDLWLHDGTGEPGDVGYMQALETVAEHFGLGIEDEEVSDD